MGLYYMCDRHVYGLYMWQRLKGYKSHAGESECESEIEVMMEKSG